MCMDGEELEGQSQHEGYPGVRITLAPLVAGTTPAQVDWGKQGAHRLHCTALGCAIPILVTVGLCIYYTFLAGGR